MSGHESQPLTRSQGARGRTRVVVVVLAVVLVVAGAVGGFLAVVLRGPAGWGAGGPVSPGGPASPASPGGSGVPGGSTPAVPFTVPFDPVADLATPDAVRIIGSADGMVVFLLQYVSAHGRDPADKEFYQQDVGHDVLRAVDATSGRIVWTVDPFPKLVSLTDAMVSDGKLALTSLEVAQKDGEQPWSCVAASVRVLAIATGDTLASNSTPAQADCGGTEDDARHVFYDITAYQDGLLALDRGTGMDLFGETLVYRDTDLARELWRADGKGSGVPTGWYESDPVLPGGWLKTQSGPYLALKDGSRAKMPYSPDDPTVSPPPQLSYFAAGDRIISLSQGSGSNVWQMSAFDSRGETLWTSPMPGGRGPQTGLCHATMAGTFLVSSFEMSANGGSGSAILAIDTATGRLAWSLPFDTMSVEARCAVLARGADQRILAVSEATRVMFVDGANGKPIGSWNTGQASDFAPTQIVACGANQACVFSGKGGPGGVDAWRMTVLDYSAGDVRVVYDRSGEGASPFLDDTPTITPQGQAVLALAEAGGYEFLVL